MKRFKDHLAEFEDRLQSQEVCMKIFKKRVEDHLVESKDLLAKSYAAIALMTKAAETMTTRAAKKQKL
jgi:hypothetical protein